MNIVENIRRIGVLRIVAQTVMHFAAGRQYEKYMKIITGVTILLLFIGTISKSPVNPADEWQAETKRLEQQIQGNIQQESPYIISPVETVALQKIEEEIRKRLNDTIQDENCIVTDVVIDLKETGIGINGDTGEGERNWEFGRVKVTLQDASAVDDTNRDEDKTIMIEEITVGLGMETETGLKETQDSDQDAKIREYRQLFAQALGIADDKVEVTYHGGW